LHTIYNFKKMFFIS